MKTAFTAFLLLITTLGFSQKKGKEPIILISTEFGNIKVRLYKETPLHRDNFVKLVKDTFYDGLLFHRVIKNFMIQGGDPKSKNAAPDVMLGEGDVGYTIPAEIVPKYFHKKGVLAAARQGDDVNPGRASSGCQFYIVQGKVFTEQELTNVEARVNNQEKQKLFREILNRPEYASMRNRFIVNEQARNRDSLNVLIGIMDPIVDAEYKKKGEFKFTEEQRKAYMTVGGAPHLDGAYTVFGEVIDGLEVVDKIADVEKNKFDRPVKDVKMKMRKVRR